MPNSGSPILLVVPCYRESARLPDFLTALCEEADASELPIEIRTVDDGSGPEEAEAMRELVARLRPRHASLGEAVIEEQNQGKGGAVYSGWDSGDDGPFQWLAFVDADGAVSAQETLRVLGETAELGPASGTCVFAVRVGGEGTEVRRTPLRKVLGKVFRLLVRIIYRLPCRDTQCGMKCVPAAPYRAVRENLHERRFVFDVELAAWLVRRGCTIREVPISWNESPGTRLRFGSALRMLGALFAVRWRLLKRRRGSDETPG